MKEYFFNKFHPNDNIILGDSEADGRNYPERNIIFLGSEFYLIHWIVDWHFRNEHQLLEQVVSEVYEGNYNLEREYTRMSQRLDLRYDQLKASHDPLKIWIHQTNYTYGGHNNRQFGVISKVRYVDAIINQDLIDENYTKALSLLKNRNDRWMIHALDTLYEKNKIEQNKMETVYTIDSLIKKIKKDVRQKN